MAGGPWATWHEDQMIGPLQRIVQLAPRGKLATVEDLMLLTVAVDSGRVDDVSGRAWLAGATAVAEEHIDGLDEVRLLVSCDPADQAAVAGALGGNATEVESWTPVVKRVDVAFGSQILALDVPANVFGDGTHPTTSSCLELVSELVEPGHHVLDLGCGAGVLTVAAALRGATVTALDIWEPAVEATIVNVERAGVADRVTAAVRSIESEDRADTVVANIGAATLIDLAETIGWTARGTIVLSGLLKEQADEVGQAYSRQVVRRVDLEDWTTLLLS